MVIIIIIIIVIINYYSYIYICMMVMQWTQNDLRIHAESTSFPGCVSHLEPQLSQLQVSPRLGINLAKREPIVGRRLSNSEVEILCSACCHLGLSENSVPLHPMVNDHYPY